MFPAKPSAAAASRVAAAGLFVVFAVLGWFLLSGALGSSSEVRTLKQTDDLNRAYQDARLSMSSAATAAYQYLYAPDPHVRLALDSSLTSFKSALDEINRLGGPQDKAVATQLETEYVPQMERVERFFSSLENHTDFTEPLPDPATVARVNTILDGPGRAQDATAQASVDAYASSQRSRVGLAAALDALGFVLVCVFLIAGQKFGRKDAIAQAELHLLRAAVLTDGLTGLGNRRAFEEGLAEASRRPWPVAMAMIDVDEFKEVNDTWGHGRGDSLLRSFAQVLRERCPSDSQLFRVGGDEFAVILPADCDAATVCTILEGVRAGAARSLGGTTVSVGIASATKAPTDDALLRQQADAALYDAKLRGRDLVVTYHPSPESAPLFPAAKLHAVRDLLQEGNVTPVFQPIWHLAPRTLLGYEGLSRPDPAYGLTGPQQAFDIAEKFGRVADLDRLCRAHILRAADGLPKDALLFINLSPYSITHQGFSAAALRHEVEAAGLRATRVVFEITERAAAAPEVIAEAVEALHAEGFLVAIDDVGTGNNGLEMLRKVRFEFVKVDHAVMVGALNGGPGRAALMAILAFSAEANLTVLAEGIESEEMMALVEDVAQAAVNPERGLIQCVQGFLLGRPVPLEQLGNPSSDADSPLAA